MWPAARAGHARFAIGVLYAGTSGFSYPAWRGAFYPERLPAGQMLSYYAARLNGVELNNTFYRMPRPEMLAAWVDATGADFRFSLKAHRGLTYSGPGFDRVGFAREFGTHVAALGVRAGPVLLQFPPGRERDVGLLDALLEALGCAAAVEFRNDSWLTQEVEQVVTRRGGAVVVTDADGWPMASPAAGAKFAYYRLRRRYDDAALASWAERIRAVRDRRCEVHVYFKHEAEGPDRALALLGMTG